MPFFGPPNIEKLEDRHNIKGLIKALSYKKNAEVRDEAAMALGRLGDAQAVEPLIATLKDEYWQVRFSAAKALGLIGDARAVEMLIVTLGDTNYTTRWVAARSLGQIGDAQAVEPLITTLEDAAVEVHDAAREALVEIGAPAVGPLIAALKGGAEIVRQLAAWALGDIGDPRAIPALIDTKGDKSVKVRRVVAESLKKLGAPEAESSPPEEISQPEVAAEPPWFAGASGWEELATTFIRLEIEKPNPDYRGLAQRLEKSSAAERHGAWIRVAQEVKNKTNAIRCYLEALYNNPDPHSVAWDWLSGEYDKDMNILTPDGPKTRETVAKLRRQYGPISE